MKRPWKLVIALAVIALGAGLGGQLAPSTPGASALDAQGGHGQPEPPMLGIHYARGQQPARPGAPKPSSPNLLYHNGTVMTAPPDVTAIFWGSSWQNYSGDEVTGLGLFYGAAGGSNYMGTNTEYTDANGQVTSNVTYHGNVTDSSAAPRRAPSTSAVLAEVAKAITSPVKNGYYPVYSDQPRGHAGYCAWHSWGTINNVQVQFAFFFKLDGDPGCDPQDTSGLHSQGLSALANVSGHELSEMMTDPRGAGWYDSQGAENADKCAWTFGPSLVKFSNKSEWKIQGNWSNAAYNANAGYPEKLGCIDGN